MERVLRSRGAASPDPPAQGTEPGPPGLGQSRCHWRDGQGAMQGSSHPHPIPSHLIPSHPFAPGAHPLVYGGGLSFHICPRSPLPTWQDFALGHGLLTKREFGQDPKIKLLLEAFSACWGRCLSPGPVPAPAPLFPLPWHTAAQWHPQARKGTKRSRVQRKCGASPILACFYPFLSSHRGST